MGKKCVDGIFRYFCLRYGKIATINSLFPIINREDKKFENELSNALIKI